MYLAIETTHHKEPYTVYRLSNVVSFHCQSCSYALAIACLHVLLDTSISAKTSVI